jgi:hypothetical protein
MLVCVKDVVSEYKQNGQRILEPICEKIYSILQTLANQDSIYGQEMQTLFGILQRMIFCE